MSRTYLHKAALVPTVLGNENETTSQQPQDPWSVSGRKFGEGVTQVTSVCIPAEAQRVGFALLLHRSCKMQDTRDDVVPHTLDTHALDDDVLCKRGSYASYVINQRSSVPSFLHLPSTPFSIPSFVCFHPLTNRNTRNYNQRP